jgi:hypothetical protein
MATLGVPAGIYGSNLRTAIVSVDTQGKVYQISNVSIAIPAIANVNITTNLDYPVCLASSNTGLLSPNVFISNTQLYFNPNTATLTSIKSNFHGFKIIRG